MANYCFLFVLVVFISKGECSESVFQPLVEYVSSQTQPYVVPQTNPVKPFTVDVQMAVMDIEEVDRRRNELWIRSWLRLAWNSTIMWDPQDFNGLTSVALPAFSGYVPQVASLASAGHHEALTPIRTKYSHNGMADFFVSARWKILCDVSKDDSCAIRMFSSDYESDVIHLRHPEKQSIDLNEAMSRFRLDNSQYRIVSESYAQGNEEIKGVTEAHDWIEYRFSFKEIRPVNRHFAMFKWY